MTMPTEKFSDMVKADMASGEFRAAFLSEAIALMVAGDMETGKTVLRHYVNGSIGFVKLGEALGRSPKSLMRMLSPQGNPQARNLFEMVAYLQKINDTIWASPQKAFAAPRRN
jgi:DNA-binding phage protein